MMFIYKFALLFHVFAGFLALLCGTLAVCSKKGSSFHIGSGRVFYFSMWMVTFTAVYLSVLGSNLFLFCIGIFSFYQNYMGVRAIKNRSLEPTLSDYIVLIIGSLNVVLMFWSANAILIGFGLINTLICARQWTTIAKIKKGRLPDSAWIKMHIGMMMGAFIATTTAFLVVNMNHFAFLNLPPAVVWFFPTFMLVPLLIYWSKRSDQFLPRTNEALTVDEVQPFKN